MGWLSRRGSLPPALLTVCCCGWARAPAVAKATPILELPNGFGMGKVVCEGMSQEFGMAWHCRDGWKMKMDWICQSKAALATLLIPVRMESRNCVPVLYRTIRVTCPIKIKILPLPRASPHHPSQRGALSGCAPCPAPAFPPRSGPSVRLGLVFIRLSFILIEVPLGFLPQCQPAHTLPPCR